MVQSASSECQNRDIKNPSPKTPTQPTDTAPTHMCVPHTWAEGRQGMRQWNLLIAAEHLCASYLSSILETF